MSENVVLGFVQESLPFSVFLLNSMGGNAEKLMNQIMDLKITSKSLQRQSRKCEKEEKAEKLKVKKAIEKGNMDGARIYAENSIRKHNEQLNYMRLASRLDAVVSRLDTQAKMMSINISMASIVKELDSSLTTNIFKKIYETMDKFETEFVNMEYQNLSIICFILIDWGFPHSWLVLIIWCGLGIC